MKKTIFVPFVLLLMAACAPKTEKSTEPPVPEEIIEEKVEPKMMENQPEQIVKISTEFGDMLIKLYNETPLHRDNFIKLTKEGFFNDLLFHRVMQDFMVQGGDPDSKGAATGAPLGSGGPGYTVPAEFRPTLFHKKGALSAARQPDNVNPQKASSGSQFYIVQGKPSSDAELDMMAQRGGITFTESQKEVYRTLGGTPFLDQQYTVFGEVISGLDVIDKIAAVQVDPRNRPIKDVKMTVTLEEE
jgi:peptidyl-prolyl cis-trans isomerase B (cyclophilin B)